MKPNNHTYADRAYESWIRKKSCLVCRSPYVEVHHVWHTGGKRGRNSYCGVPLCAAHHRTGAKAYHRLEHDCFETAHKINLSWELINYLSLYNFERKGFCGKNGKEVSESSAGREEETCFEAPSLSEKSSEDLASIVVWWDKKLIS